MMPRVQRAQDEYTDAYKKSQAPHRSDLVLIVFADGERWGTVLWFVTSEQATIPTWMFFSKFWQ